VVKRVVYIGVTLWLLRWATRELVAYSGRHWQQPGPPPRDSERPPGWMPGPRDVGVM
jgi:hypothetical protein